jgi:hypothetical protein
MKVFPQNLIDNSDYNSDRATITETAVGLLGSMILLALIVWNVSGFSG